MPHEPHDSPEWARAKSIRISCGLTPPQLMRYAADGLIRSSHIRRPGQTRGVRLFHLGDIDRLIASNVEDPYLQIDLDGKDHPRRSVIELMEVLKQDPHIQHVALSPSGDGVKALCRTGSLEAREGPEADPKLATHKDAYACAEQHYAGLGLTIDPSCRDPARLCYVTHDIDAWSREGRAIDLPVTKGADALRGKSVSDSRPISSASSVCIPDSGPAYWAGKGYSLNDLPEMLGEIGPQVLPDGTPGKHSNYDEWLKIVHAAFVGFGTDAIPALEAWRPCRKGELEEMALPKNRFKKVKFPTLIKFAQDCGWVNPHKNGRVPEIPSDVFPVPGGCSLYQFSRRAFFRQSLRAIRCSYEERLFMNWWGTLAKNCWRPLMQIASARSWKGLRCG